MGRTGEMLIDVTDVDSEKGNNFSWYIPSQAELNKSFGEALAHAEAVKMRDYYKEKSRNLRCHKFCIEKELSDTQEKLSARIIELLKEISDLLGKIKGLEYVNMTLKDIQGDTIKQVQLEEQNDELTSRITELENKNKMLGSQNLLMHVENKELKSEIATLNRKNNLLKIANKFLHNRIKLGREMFKNHQSTKELNLKKQIEKAKNDMLSNNIKCIITVLFLFTFVSIVLFG